MCSAWNFTPARQGISSRLHEAARRSLPDSGGAGIMVGMALSRRGVIGVGALVFVIVAANPPVTKTITAGTASRTEKVWAHPLYTREQASETYDVSFEIDMPAILIRLLIVAGLVTAIAAWAKPARSQ